MGNSSRPIEVILHLGFEPPIRDIRDDRFKQILSSYSVYVMIITNFSNKTAFKNKTVSHVEISPFPPQKTSNKVFSTFQHDINYLIISIQITHGKVLGYFTKKVQKKKTICLCLCLCLMTSLAQFSLAWSAIFPYSPLDQSLHS